MQQLVEFKDKHLKDTALLAGYDSTDTKKLLSLDENTDVEDEVE